MQYYNDNNDDVDDVGDRMGAKGMTWTCLLEMHSLPACQRGLYFLLFFVDFFATQQPTRCMDRWMEPLSVVV
jgi:hypothetical protein